MDTEKQKVIFMPFQIILCLSPNVHINVALNGIIIITFSIRKRSIGGTLVDLLIFLDN